MSLESLLHIDQELLIYLNNLGNEKWDALWLIITNKWSSIPIYLGILVLLFIKLGRQKGWIALIFILIAFAFTSQMTQLAKHFFERLRPCQIEELKEKLRILHHCGCYGFWSAHASNSFGFAVCTGLILRKWDENFILFLLIWASAAAYSRIYIGVHYPSDIICGALFGSFSGIIFYTLYHRLVTRLVEKKKLSSN